MCRAPVSCSAAASEALGADAAAPRFVERYLPALLTQAAHHIVSDFADVVRARSLSLLEWRVLSTLADSDPMPVGGLARRAVTKQPTLTRLVDRLARRGHLARQRDPHDRRQTLVRITPAGRVLVSDLMALAEAHQQQALQAFGAPRRQALEALLAQLIGSLPVSADAAAESAPPR